MALQTIKRTARSLIQRALQMNGVLQPNEQSSADDTQFALETLNELISSWRTQKLWQYAVITHTFNLVAGKRSYTIGLADPIITNPQPDIVVQKLVNQINEAQVLVGGQTWQPLNQISADDSFRTTVTPTANRLPYVYSFNRTMPYGTIDLLNGPDQGYTMRVIANDYLPYYDLDDIVDLPDGYLHTFTLNLSVVLCDTYGIEPSGSLQRRADEAVSVLKTINFNTGLLVMDVGPLKYNIYTDGWATVGRGGL